MITDKQVSYIKFLGNKKCGSWYRAISDSFGQQWADSLWNLTIRQASEIIDYLKG